MGKSIIFFDGECNLCNGVVQFLIKHDQKEKLLFSSLQSNTGQQLLQNQQLNLQVFETMIFLNGEKVYFKSDAALAICKELGGKFNVFLIFYVIPRPLRDSLYHILAKNRYKWFGKQEQCMVPTPELRRRFLE